MRCAPFVRVQKENDPHANSAEMYVFPTAATDPLESKKDPDKLSNPMLNLLNHSMAYK